MPTIFPNSPLDGTYLKDDFLSNSAVSDAAVGELEWEITLVGSNASTFTFVAGQNGILRSTTNATANGDGGALHLHPDAIVLAGTNQMVRCRVRFPDVNSNTLADQNFRIGFGDILTASDHDAGIWIDCVAGVLSFDAASTNGNKSVNAANAPTLTSGTTMVLDTWHDLALHMSEVNANGGPKVIKFFVDGFHAGTIPDSLLGETETMELSIVHWNTNGSGEDLELDIDYIEAWLPRN